MHNPGQARSQFRNGALDETAYKLEYFGEQLDGYAFSQLKLRVPIWNC